MPRFIWDTKNRYLATKHGVTVAEIEFVASQAKRPWPEKVGDGKLLVWGRTEAGAYLEVIYVIESAAQDLDYAEADLLFADEDDGIYVFHARYLAETEKHRYRRRIR